MKERVIIKEPEGIQGKPHYVTTYSNFSTALPLTRTVPQRKHWCRFIINPFLYHIFKIVSSCFASFHEPSCLRLVVHFPCSTRAFSTIFLHMKIFRRIKWLEFKLFQGKYFHSIYPRLTCICLIIQILSSWLRAGEKYIP